MGDVGWVMKTVGVGSHAGCTENDTPKLANDREVPQLQHFELRFRAFRFLQIH